MLTELRAVTAANSEVAKVGGTFIQLKLTIDKGNDKVEAVPMGECTKP